MAPKMLEIRRMHGICLSQFIYYICLCLEEILSNKDIDCSPHHSLVPDIVNRTEL